jgi:voltage-gated potassium channel Kch
MGDIDAKRRQLVDNLQAIDNSTKYEGAMPVSKQLDSWQRQQSVSYKTAEEIRKAIEDSTSNGVAFVWETARLLHPSSTRKLVWDLLLGILILYSVITVPFRIGFDQPATGGADIFDWIVDCFFLMDMGVCFNTAFFDDSTDQADVLVLDRKRITVKYLKTWFIIDLASTVPIDRIVTAALEGGGNLRSLKLIRVLRLVRLLKLLKLLNLSSVLGASGSEIDINPALIKLVKILFSMVFVAHLLACWWFYIAYDVEEKGLPLDKRKASWFTVYASNYPGVDIHDAGTQYASSLYWTVATMTAVGYGDVRPETDGERLFSIFTQLIGAASFGFVIGNTSALVETMNMQQTVTNQKMAEVKAYMLDRQIPKDLQQRIRTYYTYYLQQKSIFDEELILEEVSAELRGQIVIDASHGVIDKIELFAGEDTGFIVAMFSKMKPSFQLPQDIISKQVHSVMEAPFWNIAA